MIYLVIITFLLILSFRCDINGKREYFDFFFHTLLVLFILIAGLRWRLCVDTPNYLYQFYHEYPTLQEFSWEDCSFGKDPFFVLINSAVKSLGGRFYMVQLIQATLVNTLVFYYIRRHSSYFFTSLLFYFIFCYFGFSMDIMRASISIALSLYANDFFLEKKWIKGYLLLLIGCMFHTQTILLFVLPIFYFIRLNKVGVIILVASFFIGKIVQVGFSDYIMLFEGNEAVSEKMTDYAESDKYGTQGGNLNFFIVYIFPNLIYGSISLFYLKKVRPQLDLLRLEPFIMLGFVFLVFQMNMQIAYRYVDYYRIYFILFTSQAFVTWVVDSTMIKKSLAYLRTIVCFVPFFFLSNYLTISYYEWIYPYSSVIEQYVDSKREESYMKWNRPSMKMNEY
jgi:hypothetical protein